MNQLSTFVQSQLENGPKTARGRKTLGKLLDAAALEFGERGYHEAAITGITQRAGVAQGTFYVYFESKESIFRSLVSHMGHLTRQWIAGRVESAPDRLSAERIGIQAFLEFVREHKNLYRIVMEAQFVLPDAYRDYFEEFANAYSRQLKHASEKGEIRQSGEEYVWALIGMSVFLGLRYSIWDESKDPGAVASAVADLLEKGLRP